MSDMQEEKQMSTEPDRNAVYEKAVRDHAPLMGMIVPGGFGRRYDVQWIITEDDPLHIQLAVLESTWYLRVQDGTREAEQATPWAVLVMSSKQPRDTVNIDKAIVDIFTHMDARQQALSVWDARQINMKIGAFSQMNNALNPSEE